MLGSETALNFIDGKLRSSDTLLESHALADGSVLGTYASARLEDGEAAITAARSAFEESNWSRDRQLRHKVLNEIADGIERRSGDLIRMLARENGKILGEAGFELSLTPCKLRYYGALALTESGRAAEVADCLHMSSVPEPIGVAGIIVPWNSPVVLSVRSFAPALAAGCTAVVKLPGQTGLVNGMLHEILAETPRLSSGVLNSLTEAGDTLSRLLVDSPQVDVLSYTGSTRVARMIMADAAPRLKRLSFGPAASGGSSRRAPSGPIPGQSSPTSSKKAASSRAGSAGSTACGHCRSSRSTRPTRNRSADQLNRSHGEGTTR